MSINLEIKNVESQNSLQENEILPSCHMSTEDRKKRLDIALKYKEKSNFYGFYYLLKDYFFILLFIYLFQNINFSSSLHYFLGYFVLVWFIGLFQFSLSEVMLHEASHFNLFKNHKLNEYSEIFVALPFFLTFKSYHDEHNNHHTNLMKESDHLYKDYKFFGFINQDNKFDANINIFVKILLMPFLGIIGVYYFFNQSDLKSKKVIFFWVLIFGIFGYFNLLKELILFWVIPFIWSGLSYLYWSEFLDHFMVDNKFGRTRTFAMTFFTLGGPATYHKTHHEFPFVPLRNLKKLYNETEPNDTSRCFGLIGLLIKIIKFRKINNRQINDLAI